MSTTSDVSRLRQLRQKSGISVRELARRINEQPTNVSYWERTGKLPRSDVLSPIAHALGVTVEDILGESRKKRTVRPGGRVGKAFESVSKLPRRQQQQILDVIEAFVEKKTDS